ncbi:MAG: GntR family transcriptional regulator [Lachnospiraceae bacterium]|jgi:DNA-binding GntR family transcriptional regulator
MKENGAEVNEYTPLRDIVFGNLREAIVTGRLKPGEHLTEIKLSKEMGVSRTPIREAIRKLQAEGLVIINPRKGAVVAPINEKDLREILEIRKALDNLACQLASSRASGEDIKKLRDINKVMARAVEDNDIMLIADKDVEFHETITLLSGNFHLVTMSYQLKEHLYRFRLEFIKELKNKYVLVEEHGKILEAIASGDAKQAGREIEKHIERQECHILNSLRK